MKPSSSSLLRATASIFATTTILVALLLFVVPSVTAWEFKLQEPTNRLLARRDATSEWGTTCDDGWTTATTQAMCRLMGVNANPTDTWWYTEGRGTGPIWLKDVVCNASATSFVGGCSFTYNLTQNVNCGHYEDVGFMCFPWAVTLDPVSKLIKVRPGLKADLNSVPYGTVCGAGSTPPTKETALALCRMAGFTQATQTIAKAYVVDATLEPASTPVYVSNLACPVTATKLEECSSLVYVPSKDALAATACTHASDIALTCAAQPQYPYPHGGTPVWQLQVSSAGEPVRIKPNASAPWGTICSDHFSKDTAQAICRVYHQQLGASSKLDMARVQASWSTAWATGRAAVPGIIYLDELTCAASVTNINSCSYVFSDVGSRRHDCAHSEDAVVYCDQWEATLEPGTLRLQLRPQSDDGWGTVCSDGFGLNEAKAFCRMMGVGISDRIRYFATGKQATGPIYLSSVNCPAGANSIRDCSFVRTPNAFPTTCNHISDISVDCNGTTATAAPGERGMFTSEILIAIFVPLLIVVCILVFVCVRYLQREKDAAEAEKAVTRSPASQALTGFTAALGADGPVRPAKAAGGYHMADAVGGGGRPKKGRDSVPEGADSTPFLLPSSPSFSRNDKSKHARIISPDRGGGGSSRRHQSSSPKSAGGGGGVAGPLPPQAGAAAVSNPFGRSSPHVRNSTPSRSETTYRPGAAASNVDVWDL